MSTTLWQAEEVCTDGSIRNRTTLEVPASWEEGSVRARLFSTFNWCRSGEYFPRHVMVREITPEERLPDVFGMGIRGDMDARSAGVRP